MKNVRRLLVFILIFLPLLIWFALGPALRIYLESNPQFIIDKIKKSSDNYVLVKSITGDYWSGFILNDVIVYTDNNPEHLPFLDAQKVIFHLPIKNLLLRQFIPSSIQIDNFNVALHIAEDGSIALPSWVSELAADSNYQLMRSGISGWNVIHDDIAITFENGVLEIIKRFPLKSTNLTEPVEIAFTQLAGSAIYSAKTGISIQSFTGKYLVSQLTLTGNFGLNPGAQLSLTASLGKISLADLYKDIDPLFRGNELLPPGNVSIVLNITGTSKTPKVDGYFMLDSCKIGNALIDQAKSAFSYASGIINIKTFQASTHKGNIQGTATINLLKKSPLWESDFILQGINIGEYLDSNGFFAYGFTGDFFGSMKLSGNFVDLDSFKCDFSIHSSDGKYLSPFSDRFISIGLGNDSKAPINETDLTDYKEVRIDGYIDGSIIYVRTFRLRSNDLDVNAEGRIGFDRSIEAAGELSAPLNNARQNKKLSPFVSMISKSKERVNLVFNLSGHLNNIKFIAQPSNEMLEKMFESDNNFSFNFSSENNVENNNQ